MKPFRHVLFLGSLIFLLGSTFVHAQNIQGEYIDDLSLAAAIKADSSVHMREQIKYDFGQEPKHGIFRFIPVKYKNNWGNQSVSLRNVSVEDENGSPYTFVVSAKGSDIEIKIGDADKLIQGKKTYIISYDLKKVIGYFDTFDELYWNVSGNGWQVPMLHVSATVNFPKSVSATDVKSSCYMGDIGSTETCTVIKQGEAEINSVTFESDRTLNQFEGMSIAVGFPKGVVIEPSPRDKILAIVKDNWILALPIAVLVVMGMLWYKKGRDPRRSTIIPEYEAPENLTPLEASMMLNQSPRKTDVSAHIVYLATRGFIKINREVTKKIFFDGVDYSLTKTKNISEAENPIDKEIMTALFIDDTGDAAVNTVSMSSLKNRFYKKIPGIQSTVISEVVRKGYYPATPGSIIGKYILIGIACIILLVLFGKGANLGAAAVISFIASALIIIGFGIVMPKVTEKGAQIRGDIKGLKMYITIAEEDRIKFHNAPEKNPQLFEKLLPYAMVLGVETEWAKQFEDIYKTPPEWYGDSSGGMFNAVIFASHISSFRSVAAQNLASAPGGGSGSGGGGFSGGGFGGGGGGSW